MSIGFLNQISELILLWNLKHQCESKHKPMFDRRKHFLVVRVK